jgi:hypothetical protein
MNFDSRPRPQPSNLKAPERDRPTDATYAHSARAVEALITSLGL